jgi:hypothetical protein
MQRKRIEAYIDRYNFKALTQSAALNAVHDGEIVVSFVWCYLLIVISTIRLLASSLSYILQHITRVLIL